MQRSLEEERERKNHHGEEDRVRKRHDQTTNRVQGDTLPQSTNRTALPTEIPIQGRRHYSLHRGCPEVLCLGTVELGLGVGS